AASGTSRPSAWDASPPGAGGALGWPLGLAVPFEVLDGALVLLGSFARREGAEVLALARLRSLLARVEPVLAAGELANHRSLLRTRPGRRSSPSRRGRLRSPSRPPGSRRPP